MKKKNKKKPQWKPLIWTLACNFVLSKGPWALILSSFFLSKPIHFLSKIMSCWYHFNLALLALGPSSKGLRFNLWLLTNGIVLFRHTLLFGPSFKVPLNMEEGMFSKASPNLRVVAWRVVAWRCSRHEDCESSMQGEKLPSI